MPTSDPKTGFQLYSFSEIVEIVRGDFDGEGLSHSRVARSLVYPFVYVLAGMGYLFQGRLKWGVRQSFVTHASTANVRRWGAITGKPYTPASVATGDWTFTGLNDAEVPAGTEFEVNGVLWTTDALGTLPAAPASPEVDIPCTSSTATADANVSSGTTGTLTETVSGISMTVTAAEDITDGADDETRANQVERILESWAEPEQWSGSAADYKSAVRSALANVDNVGVIHPSDNVVSIYFTMDPGYGDSGGVLPTTAQKNTVQTYIDAVDSEGDETRRGITQDVTVYVATGTSEALTVAVDGGATSAQQTAIQNGVDDLYRRMQAPGEAYSVKLEAIIAAVQNALGQDYGFTLTAPAADVSATAGQIVTRGATAIT